MNSLMKNYRDLSIYGTDVSAGFQFEFYCNCCNNFTWRSSFKPHRMGQLTGWLSRFAFVFTGIQKAGRFTGAMSSGGERAAYDKAFEEAQAQARRMFTHCPECKTWACENCWNDDRGLCSNCIESQDQRRGGHGGYEASQDAGPVCPNCQVPSTGGRFCHECGFDMASTHKGCPACGSVMPRAARFCTDCGHGF